MRRSLPPGPKLWPRNVTRAHRDLRSEAFKVGWGVKEGTGRRWDRKKVGQEEGGTGAALVTMLGRCVCLQAGRASHCRGTDQRCLQKDR